MTMVKIFWMGVTPKVATVEIKSPKTFDFQLFLGLAVLPKSCNLC